jgi:uncharacterized protein
MDKPRPKISPDNQAFWQGCRLGELRLPFCGECTRPHLPPGPVCPFCMSSELHWKPATGRGRISSWTVVHKAWFACFAEEVPYNVVQVELAEGPRLTSNIVDLGRRPLVIGAPVEVVFDVVDQELALPRFRLVE